MDDGWDLLLRQVKILRMIFCSLSQIRFVTDGLGGWDLLLRQIKILRMDFCSLSQIRFVTDG